MVGFAAARTVVIPTHSALSAGWVVFVFEAVYTPAGVAALSSRSELGVDVYLSPGSDFGALGAFGGHHDAAIAGSGQDFSETLGRAFDQL